MSPDPVPLVMIDGTFRTPAEAVVPVRDDGILRGDGAFEVLRLYGGRPFGLAEHLERMARTCAVIRLEFPEEELERDVLAVVERAGAVDTNLRLVLTRGGRRIVLLEPVPDWQPVSLGIVRYTPTGVLDGTKTLSYAANMLATRWAQARGHDEALLVHPGGWLLEGPISSIFLVVDGVLVTPALEDGILASITRRFILDAVDVDVDVRRVDEEELGRCAEAFMVSSSREVQAVRRIEERTLPAPGPVTSAAAEAYRDVVARALHATGAAP